MASLFEAAGLDKAAPRPLADRLRPERLDDVVGQDHLLGPDGALTRMLATGSLGSLIFWGPPGTGKTTVARLLARETDLHFEQISAVFSGVADLKKVFETARGRRQTGKGTLLFVDEIHRFNRAQLDSFLPVMEDGTVTLVGATTENPSFELNAALLSRARVLVFKPLDEAAIAKLLARAEEIEGRPLPLDDDARAMLIGMADQDGRAALTLAEEVWRAAREGETFGPAELQTIVQRRAPIYDKSQDGHYNLISALHKSVRGSDPDAALYYLARMLDAGEQPLYIGRRLVRMAMEDIGLADPQALVIALAAKDAFDYLGTPGRRAGARRGDRLSRHRAEIERGLYRLRRRDARGQGRRLAGAAEDHPQRADQADEGRGLRFRLSLRPRRAGLLLRPGLLPRSPRPPDLLRPARPRLRARDPEAAGLLGEAPQGAGREMILFAYGSNMNPGLMADRCPEFRTIGVARLMDYRLCFPRFSRARNCATAGIEPSPGDAVWGVLYEISPNDVPVLNYHEGYEPSAPVEQNERILREVTVLRMGGSEAVTAMAYFAVPDGTDALPSAAYLHSIIDGANYHGLPKACIAALELVHTGLSSLRRRSFQQVIHRLIFRGCIAPRLT